MSALDVGKVRGFILQLPKPTTVRISTAEGPTDELKVGRQSFMRLAETICAINPDLIECLDKDGELTRAMRPESMPDDQGESRAVELPEALAGDPNAAMITHFANLLHQAYRHSTEIAFTKLVDLVDRIDSRSDSIERRLERAEADHRSALHEQIDSELDRAEEASRLAKEGKPEGEGQAMEMMQAMLAGMSQAGAKASQKVPTPPNGKAS